MKIQNPKSKIQKNILLAFVLTVLFFTSTFNLQPVSAQAQAIPPEELCDAQTGRCETDLGTFCLSFSESCNIVNVMKNYALALGGALSLIFILYGGFTLVTSNGNPQQIKKGKETITYAIVGLLLILLAVWIVILIGGGVLAIPDLGT